MLLYVERILKGAKPGELPTEQVTSDELIIKPQNGEGAWPQGLSDGASPCEQGDPVKRRDFLLLALISDSGQYEC